MKTCKNCRTENEDNIQTCTNCNYPIGGNDAEQAKFIAKQVMDKSDVDDAVKRLKYARIILFIITGYFLLMPVYTLVFNGLSLVFIVLSILSFILSISFLVFGLLSYKYPKISLLIPLILISVFYLILLIIAPYELFYKGILWKIFILLGIGYGYFSVRKSDKVLKENKYLASLVGFSNIK